MTVIDTATHLALVPRFRYLLDHTSYLIQSHGPYDTNDTGHLYCRLKNKDKLPEVRFARSLAAAQDSLSKRQPEGPVFEDLKIFSMLLGTTIELLDKIVESNLLSLESWGWGVYGLAAGYNDPCPLVAAHKQRLLVALQVLPNLHKETGRMDSGELHPTKESPPDRVGKLTLANRRAHICATLILQTLGRDWHQVRWAHMVRVCERWIQHLDLADDFGEGQSNEAGEKVWRKDSKDADDTLWIKPKEKSEKHVRRRSVELWELERGILSDL